MHFNVDDDGFVRAPVGLVYRRLTDVDRWSQWWPGVTSERRGQADAWDVVVRTGRLGPRLHLAIQDVTWRHDAGFGFQVTGDVEGHAEFWLEEGWGGTVVHHLLHADFEGGPRHLRAYRRALRRGLWAFKDAVQDEVRGALGLAP